MALDTATTGDRYGVDRFFGAAMRISDGTDRSWLIDPGPGPMSVAPRKNHNILVENARTRGEPAAEALEELATALGV